MAVIDVCFYQTKSRYLHWECREGVDLSKCLLEEEKKERKEDTRAYANWEDFQ